MIILKGQKVKCSKMYESIYLSIFIYIYIYIYLLLLVLVDVVSELCFLVARGGHPLVGGGGRDGGRVRGVQARLQ